MRVLRAISCPKEPDYPKANEDVYLASPDGRALALSDGASESFDSQTWGRLLCEAYLEWASTSDTPLEEAHVKALLSRARDRFNEDLSKRVLSWSQQAANDRGNFATLLGMREFKDYVEVLAIGDSIAIWQSAEGRPRSFPIQDPAEFAHNPVLLSSDPRGDETVFSRERTRWGWITIPKRDIDGGYVVLLTDAIGHYVLRESLKGGLGSALPVLAQTPDHFRFWLSQQRFSRNIRKDDTTFALISLHATAQS
ncbi:MAG: protein phosphatase 2C domain-containing protein [Burkholderiaceae bacterium]